MRMNRDKLIREAIGEFVTLAVISALAYHFILPQLSLSSGDEKALSLFLALCVVAGVVWATLYATVYVIYRLGAILLERWGECNHTYVTMEAGAGGHDDEEYQFIICTECHEKALLQTNE